ncbi:EpsG family protein [Lutibacter sp.]|uniref:EpsG family protein n=1 Tax=Lutibacter sp. TaxID=1925666 RepID=UPI001A1FD4C2|nr:EpsG family protein [Lutibacter sp.]MBI9041551.1 EpsG family protein [Lutibacter sp.]
MFDWIPLPYYTPVFYNTMLVVIVLAALQLFTKGYVIQNPNKKEYASILLLILVTFYLGLRPVSGRYFGDMGMYNYEFEHYAKGGEIFKSRDFVWNVFMKFCSSIMSAKLFFLLCATLYILPLYLACKKWLGKDSYFLFLMFVASFSFWAYGINGIRNGIATSLFVLALTYYKKRYIQFSLLAISYFIHGSMLIPLAAFVLTLFYKNPKYYLLGWLLAIPLSLAFGSFIENIFLSLGISDQRVSYLTMSEFDDQFSSLGFRWDFLVYSAAAIYAGYYFIIKLKFKDKIYIQLFNIYVTANAFWILVIRASFSNRFAYLSWFLMAIIIFYPFFKQQFFKQQQKVLAYLVLAYFGFTYFMFLII